MKVLLINGSPRANGCTYTALNEVASALNSNGIETEFVQVGAQPIQGCVACGYCAKTKSGLCAINDTVNGFIDKAKNADGFVFGSPVYFAAPTGTLIAFMNRAFYAGMRTMGGKVAAAVVSCRRGGASAAFDQLNKYFYICGMPIVTSQYWNSVHGSSPDDVRQDLEGMQTMRTLGNNMAWLLNSIEAGRKEGIEFPQTEKRVRTNFIR